MAYKGVKRFNNMFKGSKLKINSKGNLLYL